MNVTIIKHNVKAISIICAFLLFLAVFNLPIKYYGILRGIVFVGAILIILENIKTNIFWVFLFTLIALLFNPIYPIYLYEKIIWIPLDILTGILFLIETFSIHSKKPIQKIKKIKEIKSINKS